MAEPANDGLWEAAGGFCKDSVILMHKNNDLLQGGRVEIRQKATLRALAAFLKKDGFFKAPAIRRCRSPIRPATRNR